MELFRALAVLVEPPDRGGAGRVAGALGLGGLPSASEHTELFAFQLYPYASVYAGAEGMMGGEARARVADFVALLGVAPPAEPDHLAFLLATYAWLCESDAGGGAARAAFLWEHLLSWLPAYLEKLAELAPPFYRRWGELLMGALLEEVGRAGPAGALPLHLRAAPRLSDPRAGAGAEEFAQSLLTPARSGIILTRADLARAARSLGTGLRAGERRFALRSLLGQDAGDALGWLAAEAEGWGGRHLRHREALGAVSEWWSSRAASTGRLLRELGADAVESSVTA